MSRIAKITILKNIHKRDVNLTEKFSHGNSDNVNVRGRYDMDINVASLLVYACQVIDAVTIWKYDASGI